MEKLFAIEIADEQFAAVGLERDLDRQLPTSSRSAGDRVFRSIAATWFDPGTGDEGLAAVRQDVNVLRLLANGKVAATASFSVSMMETLLSARLLTTAHLPSGETFAMPGAPPTRMVPITARFPDRSPKRSPSRNSPRRRACHPTKPRRSTALDARRWSPATSFRSASMMVMLLDSVLAT